MKKTAVALLALLALTAATACADRRARDAAITHRVKTSLDADREVGTKALAVSTRDGVVTLEGEVASETARRRAVDIARRDPDVSQVLDRLRTAPAVSLGDPPPAERAVRAAPRPAKRQPSAHLASASTPVVIPPAQGEIDLVLVDTSAAAEHAAARPAPAESAAASRQGTAEGGGDATTAPTAESWPRSAELAEDAAITLHVRAKIEETVPSGRIQVTTRARVVTLSGAVDTELEKTQALRAARETEGVEGVVDHVVVLRS